MNIVFTGHRDKRAEISIFKEIAEKYPRSTWFHGGAIGFDSQVEEEAKKRNIPTRVFIPNYDLYRRNAPLVRNIEMLNYADLVVALYDGRVSGGTFFVISRAKARRIPILFAPFAIAHDYSPWGIFAPSS